MAEETATFQDNPYSYLRSAQQYERSGDFNGADIGYKAAIMAADRLPLSEYRRDFQIELNKYQTIPGYQTQPGVGLTELTDGYADLLSLPFRARVQFANFLMNFQAVTDAHSICKSAFEVGIDPLVASYPVCVELMESAQQLDRAIEQRLGSAQSGFKDARRLSSLVGKAKTTVENEALKPRNSGTHSLTGVEELWQDHLNAQKKAAQSPLLAHSTDEPLSCDMRTLVDSMFACLREFTKTVSVMQRYKGLNLVVTEPAGIEESVQRRNHMGQMVTEKVRLYRFRASTLLWSLSVRATDTLVEIFVVPASEVMRLSEIEHDSCLRGSYKLRQLTDKACWTSEGMPLHPEDVRVGLRNLFKEVIQGSCDFVRMDVDARTSIVGGGGLLKRISELSEQRSNLAEKIVYQQEQVQNKIARDLHDGVIGDLLAMKRTLEAEKPGDDRYVRWLENVVASLRGICSDLSPRDLQDWGLNTVVKDMVSAVAARSNFQANVVVGEQVPELPHEVQLQIYRIIQECLINIEKHSKATHIEVRVEMRDHILFVSVEDNGVGFNPAAPDERRAKVGGMGLDSIKERVQLIRCFYPAQVWINSVEGKGTRIVIQINSSGG